MTPGTDGRGPLRGLGPAARWCLGAGILLHDEPHPSSAEFLGDANTIISEGLASVALRSLADREEHQESPYLRAFRTVALDAQMRAMAVDVSGAKVLSALAHGGIPTAVIKGPAMAELYPQHWPRPYADLDVVVTRDRFLDAISGTQRLGFSYSERAVPQWKWFDLVCREGINLHNQKGGNIDFHHHVPPWVIGSGLTVEGIIERSHRAELGGTTVRFADPQDLVVISALHILNDLWKGKMGLTSWRDVLLITRQLGESGTRDAFDRAGVDWLFDMLAEELATVFPAAGIATSSPGNVPWGPRLRLATSGWANHSKASRHRLSWVTRLPPLNAIAFLAGTAFPSPSYVHTRHGSYLNYWRQGWRETVSTAHGSDFRMTTIDDYTDGQWDGPSTDPPRPIRTHPVD